MTTERDLLKQYVKETVEKTGVTVYDADAILENLKRKDDIEREIDAHIDAQPFDRNTAYVCLESDVSTLDGRFSSITLRKIADAMDELEALRLKDEIENGK